MKTVVGLFDTHAHAEAAAHDLERAGISHEDISLIANNTSGKFGAVKDSAQEPNDISNTEAETGKGAAVGGVAGLLLGLAALAIPGMGIIAAAGWLTTMVTGAIVGAGVGLVGALNGVGIPDEEAAFYNEGIKRGGTLLAVRIAEDRADEVAQILTSDGAADINERAEQYRREGFVPGVPQTDNEASTVTMPIATDGTSPSAPTHTPVDRAMPAVAMEPAVTRATLPVSSDSDVKPSPPPVRNTIPNAPAVEPSIAPLAAQADAPVTNDMSSERPTADASASRSTHDLKPAIEFRAYELYERRGRRDGLALQDWLMAEQEIVAAR